MVGTEQHGRTDLGVCEAVSARRGVLSDLPVQRITGVITASVPETDGARGVHRDAAETDHCMAFEMSCGGRSMIPRSGIFLPAVCFLIQVTVLSGFNRTVVDKSNFRSRHPARRSARRQHPLY